MASGDDDKVRLDKWLWAARFYKKRALCKQAIERGQVRYNGDRTKPGQIVKVGAVVEVRKKSIRQTVVVQAVSNQRKGAPEAALLYTETEESAQAREEEALLRAAAREREPDRKPSKRDRRVLSRFKRKLD